ncbi:hypothetical protein [Methylobacterium sp. A54F]
MSLRFLWHRFWGWTHDLFALRAKARFDHHWDRREVHGRAADELRPPVDERPPPEWEQRLWERTGGRTPNETRD